MAYDYRQSGIYDPVLDVPAPVLAIIRQDQITYLIEEITRRVIKAIEASRKAEEPALSPIEAFAKDACGATVQPPTFGAETSKPKMPLTDSYLSM
jgi:hypothetical protein